MNFVDIQVNGYAGVSFHEKPLTPPEIQHVAKKLREAGTRTILPTIVTHDLDMMCLLLRTMRELIEKEGLRKLMPAFHLEGPFLSPVEGYRGAHMVQHIRPATVDVMERLFDAAGGAEWLAMVTLAPEVDGNLATTRWLVERGVVVAAGHTDAPLEVMRDAEAAGISLFTHLGNGCAISVHRHDNILNRALSLERMKYAAIPDGAHVPFFVLRNWMKMHGIERFILTTDCVAAAACPPGKFKRPDGSEVEVGPDKVVRFPGTPYLAGAAITMADAHHNAIHHLGLTESQANMLCAIQPMKLIAKWAHRTAGVEGFVI